MKVTGLLEQTKLGNIFELLRRIRLENTPWMNWTWDLKLKRAGCQLSWMNWIWECCQLFWMNWTWECCWPSWTNQTWKYKLPDSLDKPDLKCCSFPYSF
ncbi:hypothetical protein RclHR1_04210014 [Rhizophagus clarus]|uniref:Uncharacterized protein n=1 Tax=Rhizophagus clarus TaxID=94130 RepID=A0A2Z6RFS1_9GLOM|nr:hypothetical protein RclHR1_04210014 [Rhizophagus clarus]